MSASEWLRFNKHIEVKGGEDFRSDQNFVPHTHQNGIPVGSVTNWNNGKYDSDIIPTYPDLKIGSYTMFHRLGDDFVMKHVGTEPTKFCEGHVRKLIDRQMAGEDILDVCGNYNLFYVANAEGKPYVMALQFFENELRIQRSPHTSSGNGCHNAGSRVFVEDHE